MGSPPSRTGAQTEVRPGGGSQSLTSLVVASHAWPRVLPPARLGSSYNFHRLAVRKTADRSETVRFIVPFHAVYWYHYLRPHRGRKGAKVARGSVATGV